MDDLPEPQLITALDDLRIAPKWLTMLFQPAMRPLPSGESECTFVMMTYSRCSENCLDTEAIPNRNLMMFRRNWA